MGSTDKAVITGFICRLCIKMNRFVIYIYGEEGERIKLAEKINTYLPITVNANDQLPKTACLRCIELLEAHHEFVFARRRLSKENKSRSLSLTTTSSTSINTATSNSPSIC